MTETTNTAFVKTIRKRWSPLAPHKDTTLDYAISALFAACSRLEQLQSSHDDLLATLKLVNQCHKCKYGYAQQKITCPGEADAELPCARYEEKYDGLNFIEAAIAKTGGK